MANSIEDYKEDMQKKIDELEQLKNVSWSKTDEKALSVLMVKIEDVNKAKLAHDAIRAEAIALGEGIKEGKPDTFLRNFVPPDVLVFLGLTKPARTSARGSSVTSPDDVDVAVLDECIALVTAETLTAYGNVGGSNVAIAESILGAKYGELSKGQKHKVQNKIYNILKKEGLK